MQSLHLEFRVTLAQSLLRGYFPTNVLTQTLQFIPKNLSVNNVFLHIHPFCVGEQQERKSSTPY